MLLTAVPVSNGLFTVTINTNSRQVKYVRALDPNGTEWSPRAASFPATAGDIELEVINGRPTLLFHNGSRVSIATAEDANGGVWSPAVTPSLGALSPTLGGLIANGLVPGLFYATASPNQSLRFATPFAQQFILNWIAVEP